jgi:hypothetical protein
MGRSGLGWFMILLWWVVGGGGGGGDGGDGGGVRLWHYVCRRGKYCRLLMGGCVVTALFDYLLLLTKMEGLSATDNNECTSCITISKKERYCPVRAGESVGASERD